MEALLIIDKEASENLCSWTIFHVSACDCTISFGAKEAVWNTATCPWGRIETFLFGQRSHETFVEHRVRFVNIFFFTFFPSPEFFKNSIMHLFHSFLIQTNKKEFHLHEKLESAHSFLSSTKVINVWKMFSWVCLWWVKVSQHTESSPCAALNECPKEKSFPHVPVHVPADEQSC